MAARRIELIVTGDLERAAMAPSLSRFFPERIGRTSVEWLKPQKTHGATSHRLSVDQPPSSTSRARSAPETPHR